MKTIFERMDALSKVIVVFTVFLVYGVGWYSAAIYIGMGTTLESVFNVGWWIVAFAVAFLAVTVLYRTYLQRRPGA